MGTVGLSFGSPTSGAGFNVSETVASIVSNLQNVETPWKNQLSSLESQDTVLSNLGSLFSSLSNDINSLTDFQGVLANKTGSSSDQNVLELTAASPSATAGTHTVVVNSLAQTSSGYLTPIADASDTLSGAITLQVGASGKPQTITLSSTDNTLAGLAAAINSSAVGVTASVLTDASGSRLSLVSGTSGANGNVIVSANSLVDTSGATLGYSGSAASASANSQGTLASIANANDALTGSLSIQVGNGTAEDVVIGAAPANPAANTIYTGSGVNTLAGIAATINTAAIGVTASVVTNSDGSSSLSLVSQTAGSAGNLTVASSIVDPSPSLAYTQTVAGANASLTVDGANLTSASNTVTNLIPGVTFQLLSPSPVQSGGNPEQVQVVIANDNTDTASTINQFVSDYNSLVSAINTQEGNTSSGTAEPLFGSPTLSLLQQELAGSLTTQNPNGYLDAIQNASDTLSGSISIAVGSAQAQTITLNSGDNTLAGLASAINSANFGVTANVVTNSSGSQLVLVSDLAGANGALTVSSSITDTTTNTGLNYNNGGSDISNLSQLGISVNNDGTLSLDTTTLDSVLNSDYSGVVGFFQNANSWGTTFANVLNNAGTGSSTGILALAQSANSTTESTLNANISREDSIISAEQTSLTAELNTANQVLQELPQQLNEANELYSAITGYNENPGA
jgi:flagellar hook-associated protein 2